jgi:hypothetical protein
LIRLWDFLFYHQEMPWHFSPPSLHTPYSSARRTGVFICPNTEGIPDLTMTRYSMEAGFGV